LSSHALRKDLLLPFDQLPQPAEAEGPQFCRFPAGPTLDQVPLVSPLPSGEEPQWFYVDRMSAQNILDRSVYEVSKNNFELVTGIIDSKAHIADGGPPFLWELLHYSVYENGSVQLKQVPVYVLLDGSPILIGTPETKDLRVPTAVERYYLNWAMGMDDWRHVSYVAMLQKGYRYTELEHQKRARVLTAKFQGVCAHDHKDPIVPAPPALPGCSAVDAPQRMDDHTLDSLLSDYRVQSATPSVTNVVSQIDLDLQLAKQFHLDEVESVKQLPEGASCQLELQDDGAWGSWDAWRSYGGNGGDSGGPSGSGDPRGSAVAQCALADEEQTARHAVALVGKVQCAYGGGGQVAAEDASLENIVLFQEQIVMLLGRHDFEPDPPANAYLPLNPIDRAKLTKAVLQCVQKQLNLENRDLEQVQSMLDPKNDSDCQTLATVVDKMDLGTFACSSILAAESTQRKVPPQPSAQPVAPPQPRAQSSPVVVGGVVTVAQTWSPSDGAPNKAPPPVLQVAPMASGPQLALPKDGASNKAPPPVLRAASQPLTVAPVVPAVAKPKPPALGAGYWPKPPVPALPVVPMKADPVVKAKSAVEPAVKRMPTKAVVPVSDDPVLQRHNSVPPTLPPGLPAKERSLLSCGRGRRFEPSVDMVPEDVERGRARTRERAPAVPKPASVPVQSDGGDELAARDLDLEVVD